MGGHGGLNILPQKSWNVYNFEAREKVRKDEEAAAATEAAAAAKREQAEREFRHNVLLQRAAERRGAGGGEAGGAAAGAGEGRDGDAAPLAAPAQHINFFEQLEARAQHPEVEAAAREELRQRGRPDQQTSDARLDARSRLGVGDSDGSLPWYARAGSSLEQPPPGARRRREGAPIQFRPQEPAAPPRVGAEGGPLAAALVPRDLAAPPEHDPDNACRRPEKRQKHRHRDRKEKEKDKRHKKERRRRHHSRSSSSSRSPSPAPAPALSAVLAAQQQRAALRAERLAREQAEQRRQVQLLAGSAPAAPPPSGYYSGYGYGKAPGWRAAGAGVPPQGRG